MSDFCFVEEACQAKDAIGEGPLGVESVCRIVKLGCKVEIKIEPFAYLTVSVLKPEIGQVREPTQWRVSDSPRQVPMQ